MKDGMVRKWVKSFKDGRTNVGDDERGRLSVVTGDLVRKGDEKVKENGHFTISSLSD